MSRPRDLAAGIVQTDPSLVLSLGAPATLYCLAYGFPRPTVTWWKGTRMLALEGDGLSQVSPGTIYNQPVFSDITGQGEDGTLHLADVRLSDLGPYTCQVVLLVLLLLRRAALQCRRTTGWGRRPATR